MLRGGGVVEAQNKSRKAGELLEILALGLMWGRPRRKNADHVRERSSSNRGSRRGGELSALLSPSSLHVSIRDFTTRARKRNQGSRVFTIWRYALLIPLLSDYSGRVGGSASRRRSKACELRRPARERNLSLTGPAINTQVPIYPTKSFLNTKWSLRIWSSKLD